MILRGDAWCLAGDSVERGSEGTESSSSVFQARLFSPKNANGGCVTLCKALAGTHAVVLYRPAMNVLTYTKIPV